MNRRKRLKGLDFDDDATFNHKLHSIRAINPDSLIDDRNSFLHLEREPCVLQLVAEAR